MLQYLYMMMSSWALVCDVWYLPPMHRRPEENAIEFANRVKAEIAKQGGLVDLAWYVQKKKMYSNIKFRLETRNTNLYSSNFLYIWLVVNCFKNRIKLFIYTGMASWSEWMPKRSGSRNSRKSSANVWNWIKTTESINKQRVKRSIR